MIPPSGIARYLVRQKFLRSRETIAGAFTIVNASRRNHVFKVLRTSGPSYLIKEGVDAGRVATIRRESSVYRALGAHPDFNKHLPRHFASDRDHQRLQLLTLELLAGTQNLRQYHESLVRTPTLIGRMLGEALAALHSLPPANASSRKTFARLRNREPGILRLSKPHLPSLRNLSAGTIELIKIVQRFGFAEHLEKLRGTWRPLAFTHGDLRWENCLVPLRPNFPPRTRLKIVDWEFAGLGDPAWDVGFVFAEYLGYWISLIPVTGESLPDRYLNMADISLDAMQPALRSFWSSYRRRMATKINSEKFDHRDLLLRSVRYAAARLLQTAYEEMSDSSQLTGSVICLAQLSLNIFLKPQQACAGLLGIPC
jgi:aminoglycoside phosphotransferase (APT) family kinase protein